MQLEQDVDRFKIWKVIGGSFLQELIDVEGDGMADMVFRCIQEMDIDNRMMVLAFFPYCTPDIYILMQLTVLIILLNCWVGILKL